MDGENNGKPYFLMDDLGGPPLFLEASMSKFPGNKTTDHQVSLTYKFVIFRSRKLWTYLANGWGVIVMVNRGLFYQSSIGKKDNSHKLCVEKYALYIIIYIYTDFYVAQVNIYVNTCVYIYICHIIHYI